MGDETSRTEQDSASKWPTVMSWAGRASALIGLFVSFAGGVTWLINHHRKSTEREAKIALAQTQTKQGEYQAAADTYDAILKADPADNEVLEQQLDVGMQWAENFHALGSESQYIAGRLDEIMSVLDAGLTRSKGSRAADVQAHIGWAHWLNEHIAHREFGDAAEKNFRAALSADPNNVYANAMLGNLILQNHGNVTEADTHFKIALATGKVRPFVRGLQLGGLIYLERPGACAEMVRTADEMRKSGEPMDEADRSRILGFCFNPMVTDRANLGESLSAIPPDDAWSTYLWLDDNPENTRDRELAHQFIQANLAEISGKRRESLDDYKVLQKQLKNAPGSMKNSVDAAVSRLSHG
jgi:hypothetical protein